MTLRLSTPLASCLLAPVLALSLGCDRVSVEASPQAPLEVRRGTLEPRLLLTGEVVAEESIELVTPNANIWPVPLRWLAEDGAMVRAGDPVVEFDNSQLVNQLENLESQLVEARNQLESIRARVGNELSSAYFEWRRAAAEEEKKRLDADLPEGLLAEQEYERRRLDWQKAQLESEAKKRAYELEKEAGEKEIAIQEIAVEKARAAVERARRGIELLAIEAPRDGIVLVAENPQEDRPFKSGDNAFPGLSVARMPDLSTLRVEARLFDVDDGRVRAGESVEAVLDAFPGEALSGVVREVDAIADAPDRQSTRRSFRVKIDVEGLDPERVRPGMSVRVLVRGDVVRGDAEPARLVPRVALDWSGGVPRLVLADGSTVEVRLGACDPRSCVLEEGPEEGTALGSAGGSERT